LTSTSPAAIAGAEDLLALASKVDGEVNAPPPGSAEAQELERQAQAQPKLPLERELAGMFAMIGTGVGQFLPRAGAVLTTNGPDGKSAADRLGDVLAPVARKYGLDRYLEGFAWRLELQALMVAGPVAFAIVQAAKLDIAELKQRQAEADGRAPQPGVTQGDAAQPGVTSTVATNAVANTVGMLQPTGGYIPQ